MSGALKSVFIAVIVALVIALAITGAVAWWQTQEVRALRARCA